MSALEESGNKVTQLRRRLQLEERVDEMARLRVELEQRSHDLYQQQVLPIWILASLGGLFVLGVVLIVKSNQRPGVNEHRFTQHLVRILPCILDSYSSREDSSLSWNGPYHVHRVKQRGRFQRDLLATWHVENRPFSTILATMLAPTDAVLGKAVVTNPAVPEKVRESSRKFRPID